MIFRAGANGRIYWKDYGLVDPVGFDSIAFVHQQMLLTDPNASRHDAVLRVWDDLVVRRSAPAQVLLKKPKRVLPFTFEAKDRFQEWELAYWRKHLVGLPHLRFLNIHPVLEVTSNGRTVISSRPNDPAFLYLYDELPWAFKSYRPLAPNKADKFRGQGNGGLLEGYEQLPKVGEHLIITKATKDVAVLRAAGYIACSPTSENSLKKLLATLPELMQRFRNVCVWFDPDTTGMLNTAKVVTNSSWRIAPVTPPGHLAEHGLKDPADMVYRTGRRYLVDDILRNFAHNKYHV